MNHLPHSDYYHDRDSEEELCRDFPADEIFIYGLHAMQMHFWSNNIAVEIPVVRVMNTAHYIAAYMFATTCSGDQMEYDVLAYDSLSRDKQLTRVAMIVLAAMLQRTEGFRARNCRNLILDNRDPDFEEGVTLYDRFLRSAEKHFAEEDFLIDIPALMQRNQQLEYENRQLVTENKELKYTLTKMENQQNNQYNNCVIYNAAVYNTTTTNNYYPQAATKEDIEPVQEEKPIDSIIFTKKAKKEGQIPTIIQAFKSVLANRRDKSRALAQEVKVWQKDEYIDAHYNAQVMYDEIAKIMPLPFGYEAFKQHYNNTRF